MASIDGPNPLISAEAARVSVPATGAQRATPAGAEGAAESRFTLTPDLADLLANVRQNTEVRQEVIGEMARRLASGELLTRSAAESVVQGILEAHALTSF